MWQSGQIYTGNFHLGDTPLGVVGTYHHIPHF